MGSTPSSCAWCGADLRRDGVRLDGRIGCRACGAATTDPWPSEAELARAYGDWYRPPGEKRFASVGDAILSRTRGSIAGRLDRIAPPGPVLDVGAGDGTLVDAVRARGRDATGLERDSGREDLREQSLEELEGTGSWAAVVFWHSLEHLPRPGAAIEEAARLLEPGGVVAIAVPNGESLQARAFGGRWLHLDPPRHLVHLSTRSLVKGLVSSGFSVERISQVRGGQVVIGWLDGLVGSLPGDLRLYRSLRRAEARDAEIGAPRRLAAIAAGVALLPVAATGALVEVVIRRAGTVYVEARLG